MFKELSGEKGISLSLQSLALKYLFFSYARSVADGRYLSLFSISPSDEP
jgi:hypothetical protein